MAQATQGGLRQTSLSQLAFQAHFLHPNGNTDVVLGSVVGLHLAAEVSDCVFINQISEVRAP